MYQVFYDIIDHVYSTGDQMQSYILYGCIACIIIFAVVLIDMIYRIFSHFWRGRK